MASEMRRDGSSPAGCPEAAFIGTSRHAERVRDFIRRFALHDAPVLVEGETGVGKEVVARALHEAGPRSGSAFVPLNCAALPDALLEGELFGSVRGAYTGADRDRPGLLVAASGGTLFLDEIGELSLQGQAKLLRFLDGGTVRPLGAVGEKPVNVRVVAATHRDLQAEVRAARFRQDLWFRLAVFHLRVAPLRERSEDLPALVRHFAERLAGDAGGVEIESGALRDARAWHWPGNGRELLASLQRSLVEFGPRVRTLRPSGCSGMPPTSVASLESLLRHHRGDVQSLAVELGVSVRTVQRRLARAGLRAAAYRKPLSANGA